MMRVSLGICSLLFLLSSFTAALAQPGNSQSLFLMWDERGKYGFIDARGNVVIRPQFDCALPFTEGLAAVSINGKWGFIDASGKVAVPLNYFAASHFSDGVAAVYVKEGETRSCGYIDHAGEFVIKPQNKFTCTEFNDGYAVVEVYSEKWGEDFSGYMNKAGELAIGGEFVRADPFSEGFAYIVDYDQKLFINTRGQTVIDLSRYGGADALSDKYEPAGSFSEGLAEVGIKIFSRAGYARYGFVNKDGKVVFELPERFRVEGAFHDGRALVLEEKTEKVRVNLSNGESFTMDVDVSGYGYVDKTGRVVVPTRFSQAEGFSDGLAAVKTGKPQPADRRDLAGSAAEGALNADEGNWVCINTSGKVVIKRCGEPLSREEIDDKFQEFGKGFGKGFTNGLFFGKTYVDGNRAGARGKAIYGYMDKTGKYVWLQPYGENVKPPRWLRENYP